MVTVNDMSNGNQASGASQSKKKSWNYKKDIYLKKNYSSPCTYVDKLFYEMYAFVQDITCNKQ